MAIGDSGERVGGREAAIGPKVGSTIQGVTCAARWGSWRGVQGVRGEGTLRSSCKRKRGIKITNDRGVRESDKEVATRVGRMGHFKPGGLLDVDE